MIKRFGSMCGWAEVRKGYDRQRLSLKSIATSVKSRNLFCQTSVYLMSFSSHRERALQIGYFHCINVKSKFASSI
jgi:hypothetical protein